jgi:hypothetical protein
LQFGFDFSRFKEESIYSALGDAISFEVEEDFSRERQVIAV